VKASNVLKGLGWSIYLGAILVGLAKCEWVGIGLVIAGYVAGCTQMVGCSLED